MEIGTTHFINNHLFGSSINVNYFLESFYFVRKWLYGASEVTVNKISILKICITLNNWFLHFFNRNIMFDSFVYIATKCVYIKFFKIKNICYYSILKRLNC